MTSISPMTMNVPRARAAAIALLAWVLAMEAYGALTLSPTIDEPLHMSRGVAVFCSEDLRMNFAHPPLANALSALPVVLARGCRALERMPGWDAIDHSLLVRHWLETDYADLRGFVVGARWFSIACVLALIGCGYLWLERRFGAAPALAFAALIAGNLTVLAHGQLVTTDAPMLLAALLCLCAVIDRIGSASPSWRGRAALAAAAAFAVSVKHSAVPFLTLLALVHLALGVRKPQAARAWALDWLACGAAALLAVGALYRFEGVLETFGEWKQRVEPSNLYTGYRPGNLVASSKLLKWLPDSMPMPLPHGYVVGLLTVQAQNAREGSSFLFQLTRGGTWMYFPVLLVLKQPIVVLIAQLGSLAALPRLPEAQRPAWTAAWIAAAVFLALSCASGINLGVRHALPFIVMASLPAALWVATLLPRWRTLLSIAALTLPVEALVHRHDFIGYFNLLAGGRAGGHEIAMIGEDWAQDTGRAGELLLSRGIREVKYMNPAANLGAALRTAELRHTGLEVHPIACEELLGGGQGWALIERTMLYRKRHRCLQVVAASRDTEVLFDHWQLMRLAKSKPKSKPRP